MARLFRTIERNQREISLVGLSDILPNYHDVAEFLKVDREKGLFHFGNAYRPIPLTINFYGVKDPDISNTMGKKRTIDIYNEKCYEKCLKQLRDNKQALVVVNSRKETTKFS